MSSGSAVTVQQVADKLGLKVLSAEGQLDAEVAGCIVGDLLSHIMAHGKRGYVWVTIQTHPNIVAVAALGELAAIVVADGFEPEEDTVARAQDEGIPMLASSEPGYAVACGLCGMGVR